MFIVQIKLLRRSRNMKLAVFFSIALARETRTNQDCKLTSVIFDQTIFKVLTALSTVTETIESNIEFADIKLAKDIMDFRLKVLYCNHVLWHGDIRSI